MNIWILNADTMEDIRRKLNLEFDFANQEERKGLMLMIDLLDEIKNRATKVNDYYTPITSELTTKKDRS